MNGYKVRYLPDVQPTHPNLVSKIFRYINALIKLKVNETNSYLFAQESNIQTKYILFADVPSKLVAYFMSINTVVKQVPFRVISSLVSFRFHIRTIGSPKSPQPQNWSLGAPTSKLVYRRLLENVWACVGHFVDNLVLKVCWPVMP